MAKQSNSVFTQNIHEINELWLHAFKISKLYLTEKVKVIAL